MTRPDRLLKFLLAVQMLLSVGAGVVDLLPACAACGTGRLLPAVLGMLGYAVLLGRTLTAGLTGDVFVGILFAGGIHAALAVRMMTSGIGCPICVAAALVSLIMMGIVVPLDRANLGRLALLTPSAALLVLAGGSLLPAAALREPEDRVAILVYEQADCGYCEELRKTVLPEIQREFGNRVRVELHAATELAAIRRTPTLILGSGRRPGVSRVIEGLPGVERLRGVIRELETAP